jgi:hypothetical protein
MVKMTRKLVNVKYRKYHIILEQVSRTEWCYRVLDPHGVLVVTNNDPTTKKMALAEAKGEVHKDIHNAQYVTKL